MYPWDTQLLSLTGYEKQSLFMRCTGPESYFFPRPSTQHPGNSAR
uniref:Uncharacterized protein n=1 Tax=Klebsiella pneumoniae TaxID=573 RepID=A0A6M6A312_KLEPN|nr:hypothetical protein [Klebsiella pneumoniae]